MLNNELPIVELLDSKFEFIKNQILKENIAISIQYILFLLKITKNDENQGSIKYSIYKNIIIYVASIVESLLHFTLKEGIDNGLILENEVLNSTEKYENSKILYKIDDNRVIIGAEKRIAFEKLKDTTQFLTINKACKKAKIINDYLFERVEKLRDERNKVHLAGLKKVYNFYSQEDLKYTFETLDITVQSSINYLSQFNY